MGCCRIIHEILSTYLLAGTGNSYLAGFAYAPTAHEGAYSVLAALALKGIALGYELRAVLASTHGLEQGGLAGVVDYDTAQTQTTRHARIHERFPLEAHPICPDGITK